MITKSFDEILASVKSRIAEVSNLDTAEGSYADTTVRAAAMEIFYAYFDQQALLPIVFVDETSGGYIDMWADKYGIYRKDGTRATAEIVFLGRDGIILPAGMPVQTQDGLVFLTDEETITQSGRATAHVTAAESGSDYNVAAGAITTTLNSVGVVIESASAASGGTDIESDASLVARLYALWRKPATSGNANQYEAWAMEVQGVGAAKIWPCWSGGGTVKIAVLDSNMRPAASEIISDVSAHIEALRPICVDVTVVPASEVDVTVTASIHIDATTTIPTVEAQFRTLLDAYCRDTAFKSQTVVYSRIAYMLLSVDGVIDMLDLRVNGGTVNITLADDAVPVLGEVSVS